MAGAVLSKSRIFHRSLERVFAVALLLTGVFLCSCAAGGGSDDADGNSSTNSNGDDNGTIHSGGSDTGTGNGSPADDDGGSADDGTDNDAGASAGSSADAGLLRISSFNTGLLPLFVPLADERVAPLAQALAAHDADVLCLQEVWSSGDQTTLANALRPSYPNIYIAESRQKFSTSAPVCSAGELAPVADCALTQCLGGTSDVFTCLESTCHDEIYGLAESEPECAEAITAQAGKSVLDIFDVALQLFTSSEPQGLFAFDGSPGIVVASRLPLQNVQVVDFFDISTTSRRVAVLAAVSKNGRRVHIGCTHLQSNQDGLIPYTGSFGSWAGEQHAQAQRLLTAAAAAAGSEPQYLAGDFNCSAGNPAKGVVSELESNYDLFPAAGYADPAASQLDCTFCSANLLNQANTSIAEARDTQLDHIFTKNLPSANVSIEKIFTETVNISGQPENLSDHFGLRLSTALP
jgi:endonuclease/exonuclease/phosphatase family metal-dependent hydrolase